MQRQPYRLGIARPNGRPPATRPSGVNKDWDRDVCIVLRRIAGECFVCKVGLLPGQAHCPMQSSEGLRCAEHCDCAPSVTALTK